MERDREEQVAVLLEGLTLVAELLLVLPLVRIGGVLVGVALDKGTVRPHDVAHHLLAVVVRPAADVPQAVVLEGELETALQADRLLQVLAGLADLRHLGPDADLVEVDAGLGIIVQLVAGLGVKQIHVGQAEDTLIQRNLVLSPAGGTLLVRDVDLAADAGRLVHGRVDEVLRLVRSIAVRVHQRLEIRLTGDLGITVLDDGPAQTLIVARIEEGLLQVAGRQAPGPAVVRLGTVAGHDRDGVAQVVGSLETGLELEDGLLVVVGGHIPDIAEVLHQVVLAGVDHLLEHGLGLGPPLLVDIGLAEHAEGRVLRGTADVGGAIAGREHLRRLLEVLLDLGPHFLRRVAGHADDLVRHLEGIGDGHAAEGTHELEIEEAAQELGLGHEPCLHRLVVVCGFRDARDGHVAPQDTPVALLVEVVARRVGLADTLEVRDGNVVGLGLRGVAHPGVVGAHLGEQPEVVDLPPSVERDCIVAAREVGYRFFLRHEVGIQVLGAAYRLVQEVRAGGTQHRCDCENNKYPCFHGDSGFRKKD